ncbi:MULTISPECIES: hypothetical protein [Priestia]|uniref:hypothetical protein n=1 Tax=Priestia TaxID=2800373 RepID=UPI001F278FC9|nr:MULTISPECIES: hypothetical protein [Priestia]MCM3253405.1 hypothetical protein [Priestia aryabhattai]
MECKAGDKVTCECILTEVEKADGFQKVKIKSADRNQQSKGVLIGTSNGIIRD